MAQIAAGCAKARPEIIIELYWYRRRTRARAIAYFCAKDETPCTPAISIGMKPLKSIQDMRAEVAALITEAVPETDDMRRRALLAMADHWRELIDRRRASPA